jgi:hypothetical protein
VFSCLNTNRGSCGSVGLVDHGRTDDNDDADDDDDHDPLPALPQLQPCMLVDHPHGEGVKSGI